MVSIQHGGHEQDMHGTRWQVWVKQCALRSMKNESKYIYLPLILSEHFVFVSK